MSDGVVQGCINCEKFTYNLELEFVDELGQPISDVPYTIYLDKNKKVLKEGATDGNGRIIVDGLPALALSLVLDTEKLLEVMQEPARHLRLGRTEADSTIKPRAEQQGREYSYVTVGKLINVLPAIPDWPEKRDLPYFHFPDKAPQGGPIRPWGNVHARMLN